jgi:hypothetical protein
MIKIIATTMSNSIREKPFCFSLLGFSSKLVYPKSWNSLAGYTAVSARRRPVATIAENVGAGGRSRNGLNAVRHIINSSYSYGDNRGWKLWGTSPYCGCADGLNAAREMSDARGVPNWNAGSRVASVGEWVAI